jgi:diguanylate cyclase (GGDEF)-like protein
MTREPSLFRDALTGTFLRSYFMDRLSEAVDKGDDGVAPVSLLIVDLDDLFLINIIKGRAGGDQVLRELGAILLRSAREADVVARLGADQFALLLPSLQLDVATQYAISVRKLVARAHADGRSGCAIDVCIGVAASTPEHPQFAETLLQMAERRLDAAKRSRRSPGATRHVWAGPVTEDDDEDR